MIKNASGTEICLRVFYAYTFIECDDKLDNFVEFNRLYICWFQD